MEQTNPTTTTAPVAPAPIAAAAAPVTAAPARRPFRGGSSDRKGGPKRSARPEKVKSEYDQRILNIRRVTRVVSGGRRFSFSVAILIGNHKGSVGVGTGKAGDTSLAIEKALKDAKKNLLKVQTTKDMSIAHEVDAKYASARVVIRPAKGRGLIAGSALRDIFELGGIGDISAKIISPSKNKLNIARATIKALGMLTGRPAAHTATVSTIKAPVKAK